LAPPAIRSAGIGSANQSITIQRYPLKRVPLGLQPKALWQAPPLAIGCALQHFGREDSAGILA
jgi:hypothetical protein